MLFLMKIEDALCKIENIMCALGLLGTTFSVFIQVLNRYIFNFEIIWINDAALYIFVFFMYFAFLLSTRENGHIAVDALAQAFVKNNPNRKAWYAFIIRIFSICSLFVLLPQLWRFFARAWKYPQIATLLPWFNTSWMMEGLFIVFCFALFHLLVHLINEFYTLREM